MTPEDHPKGNTFYLPAGEYQVPLNLQDFRQVAPGMYVHKDAKITGGEDAVLGDERGPFGALSESGICPVCLEVTTPGLGFHLHYVRGLTKSSGNTGKGTEIE